MKKMTIYIVLAVLCLNFTAHAQNKPDNIISLKIGDTVPDITINKIINYKDKNGKPIITAKLSDFKGKLLILNFWSTSCGTCVSALPKVESLQKEYKDQVYFLSVSYEKEQRVKSFLSSNFNGKNFTGSIVTDDTLLKKIFVHQYLPNIVLIKDGIYIQSWPEEYLNSENIKGILTNRNLKLEQKTDVLNFDYSKPIFSSQTNQVLNSQQRLFATVFSGFIYGLPTKAGYYTDTIHHFKRYYVINHTVLHMYALALNSSLPITPNRTVLEVSNPGLFTYHKEVGYLTDWRKSNCYTYERTCPLSTSNSTIAEQLKNDLDLNLNTYGRIEDREVQCLELHISPQSKLKSDYLNQEILKDTSGSYKYLHHIHAEDLVYILNQQNDAPPIIDETGVLLPFDLNFNKNLEGIKNWQKVLKSYGFELKPVLKRLPMFVLSDKMPIPVSKRL